MRLVVDTNILISALLFRGVASALHTHWTAGSARLLMSPATESELLRVLAYPKFRLSPDQIAALVSSEVLPFRDRVEVSTGPAICRDGADDPFLWCARAGHADALVAGDGDLLAVGAAWEGVRILRLVEILEILRGGEPATPPSGA